MLDKQTYEIMKQKYGPVGSWAVWTSAGSAPKSFTDDMSWVNDPSLLETLNTGFVFVGRCWSRGDPSSRGQIPWADFHSDSPHQNDYKLRYALKGTKYWGSYITDFYKLDFDIHYLDVDDYAKEHPEFVRKNLATFQEEISYLGDDIVLVAFGNVVYNLLKKHLGDRYRIVKIMNYAAYISKEEYRTKVLEVLNNVV